MWILLQMEWLCGFSCNSLQSLFKTHIQQRAAMAAKSLISIPSEHQDAAFPERRGRPGIHICGILDIERSIIYSERPQIVEATTLRRASEARKRRLDSGP